MRTALFLLLAVACAAAFRCQQVRSAADPRLTLQIINTYNAHVNTGNFTGAAALTFAENVRYIIPGTQPQCPYCTTYEGKAAVISLFVDGFLGHFTILNPLVNLREITTDTGGPGGVPELMDFNGAAPQLDPNDAYFSKMKPSAITRSMAVGISVCTSFTVRGDLPH